MSPSDYKPAPSLGSNPLADSMPLVDVPSDRSTAGITRSPSNRAQDKLQRTSGDLPHRPNEPNLDPDDDTATSASLLSTDTEQNLRGSAEVLTYEAKMPLPDETEEEKEPNQQSTSRIAVKPRFARDVQSDKEAEAGPSEMSSAYVDADSLGTEDYADLNHNLNQSKPLNNRRSEYWDSSDDEIDKRKGKERAQEDQVKNDLAIGTPTKKQRYIEARRDSWVRLEELTSAAREYVWTAYQYANPDAHNREFGNWDFFKWITTQEEWSARKELSIAGT